MSTTDDYTVTVKTVFDKTQTKKDWNKLLKELQKEILLKVKVDNKMDTTNLKTFQQQLIEISKEAVSAREAIRNMGTELSNIQVPDKITIPVVTVQKQKSATTSSSGTGDKIMNKVSDTASTIAPFNTLYSSATNMTKITEGLFNNSAWLCNKSYLNLPRDLSWATMGKEQS